MHHSTISIMTLIPRTTTGSMRRFFRRTASMMATRGNATALQNAHPPGELAGDRRDALVVGVVVQHADAVPFGDGRDDQVRQRHRAKLAASGKLGLDAECTPQVAVLRRQPFAGM